MQAYLKWSGDWQPASEEQASGYNTALAEVIAEGALAEAAKGKPHKEPSVVPLRLALLGAPFSGKTTMARKLAEECGCKVRHNWSRYTRYEQAHVMLGPPTCLPSELFGCHSSAQINQQQPDTIVCWPCFPCHWKTQYSLSGGCTLQLHGALTNTVCSAGVHQADFLSNIFQQLSAC